MIVFMPSEVLEKARDLVPVRKMITRDGKSFMTTVFIQPNKKDREESAKHTALVPYSDKGRRDVSRSTVELMRRTEEVIDFAPNDSLAVDKILKFQSAYFKNKPKPSMYEVVQMAEEEVRYALSQPGDSGKDWYESSMKSVRFILSTEFPSLAGDTDWDFFLSILAVTSPGVSPKANLNVAISVYSHHAKTGKISVNNPVTGKAYSIASTANLTRLKKVLKSYPDKAAFVAFMNGVSTMGELVKLGAGLKGRGDEAVFNSMRFGEKVGMFYQSVRGTEGAVAIDRWAIRSFYRWTGALSEIVKKHSAGERSGQEDRTVNDTMSIPDRKSMEYVLQTVGEKLGLQARQVQAVMWYYEKRLYQKLGMRSTDTADFAMAATKLYLKKSRDDTGEVQALMHAGKMPTFDQFIQAIMEIRA